MSQRIAVPPEKVAAVVEAALTARRPRARYVVGVGPKLQVALVNTLPTTARDRLPCGFPANRADLNAGVVNEEDGAMSPTTAALFPR